MAGIPVMEGKSLLFKSLGVEQGLKNFKMPPIFHDDQHGTAIVVLASFINAIKVSKKNSEYCKIVINGAGASGITIAKLLIQKGCANIIICDTVGSIFRGRKNNMNPAKQKLHNQLILKIKMVHQNKF